MIGLENALNEKWKTKNVTSKALGKKTATLQTKQKIVVIELYFCVCICVNFVNFSLRRWSGGQIICTNRKKRMKKRIKSTNTMCSKNAFVSLFYGYISVQQQKKLVFIKTTYIFSFQWTKSLLSQWSEWKTLITFSYTMIKT